MKALLLCGGFGTRLGELTRELPKALLPVGEWPLIHYTLSWLAREGIDHVFINLHYQPEAIPDYVGDGSKFGLTVSYHFEPQLLGTAGTVRELHPLFGGEDVVVVYGDLLIDQSLAPLRTSHQLMSADATLLVHRRAGSNSVVVMSESGRIIAFSERPDSSEVTPADFWVNSGVQLLSARARAHIPPTSPADLPRDLYVPNVSQLRFFGVPLTGFRCAIDSPERYHQAVEAVHAGAVHRPPARE